MSDSRWSRVSGAPHAINWLLLLLIAAGVGMRIFAAWCVRHCPSPDYGIVGLMAKHMAEGRDIPVFFYGQSYMGSLEPAVSALMVRLFGCTGFSVCLGTAAVACLFLPLVYVWGRAAGGRAAGLAALALCVIGSWDYFCYLASPRGSYAVTLVAGTLVLWLSGRIAAREGIGREPAPLGWYLVVGFAAGIGWWSNPLILASLLSAAVVLALALRHRLFSLRVAAAGAAFFAGSMPWWVWNIGHEWDSLTMVGSLGKTPLGKGLILYAETFVRLLVADEAPLLLRPLVVAAVVLASGVALARVARNIRGRKLTEGDVHILAAFLVVLVSALFAARSHYMRLHAARYLLPIWPALAVFVGVAAVEPFRNRWGRGIAWLPLVILLAAQAPVLRGALGGEKAYGKQWERAAELAEFAQNANIEALYGSYWASWMNFATRERVCLSGLEWERYAPYERKAAAAERYAVMNDYMELASFLKASGGSSKPCSAAGFKLDCDIRPPLERLQVVPSSRWETARDQAGQSVAELVGDGNLDTWWHSKSEPTNENPFVEVRFRRPTVVAGIRLWSRHGCLPRTFDIQVEDAEAGAWIRPFEKKVPASPLFWSGPRLYCGGLFYRQEIRFPARQATAVSMAIPPEDFEYGFQVSEMEVLELAEGQSVEAASMAELAALLSNERRVRMLYADRWSSERIHLATEGRIRTHVEFLFRRRMFQLPREKHGEYPVLVLSPDTALLTLAEDAPVCRERLAKWGITMRETRIGPWTLFDFAPGAWRWRYGLPVALHWAGPYCLYADARPIAKQRAFQVNERRKSRPEGAADDVAAIQKVLKEYPRYQPALADLELTLRKFGRGEEADRVRAELRDQTVPRTAARVRFSNGVELLGVTVEKSEVRPGAALRMRYYWHCPPDVDLNRFAVFAHWLMPGRRFQDDHVLLEDETPENVAFQPFREVFVEKRLVEVPKTAESGEYRLGVGLLDRVTGKRLKARTDLPQKHNMVNLPVTIRVDPGAAEQPAPRKEESRDEASQGYTPAPAGMANGGKRE